MAIGTPTWVVFFQIIGAAFTLDMLMHSLKYILLFELSLRYELKRSNIVALIQHCSI